MIKIIKGDLIELGLQGKVDVIAHGCNCYGVMGAGFAKQIADTFPIVEQEDIKLSKSKTSPKELLGTILCCDKQKPIIVNCYTQTYPGANFNIYAFKLCMIRLRDTFPNLKIGIPEIGCGIGGAKKEDVYKALSEIFIERDITVVKFKINKLR